MRVGHFKGFSEKLAYYYYAACSMQHMRMGSQLVYRSAQHSYRESYEYLVSLVRHLGYCRKHLKLYLIW